MQMVVEVCNPLLPFLGSFQVVHTSTDIGVDLTIEELWEIDPQFACMGKFHALRFTDFNKFSKEA